MPIVAARCLSAKAIRESPRSAAGITTICGTRKITGGTALRVEAGIVCIRISQVAVVSAGCLPSETVR